MSEERDLLAWLCARVDDDERLAASATPGPWRWVDPGWGRVKSALVAGTWQPDGQDWEMVLPAAHGDVYPSKNDADFIAHHDPTRALREVEAKRTRLAIHRRVEQDPEMLGSAWTTEPICDWCTDHWAVREGGGRDALVPWPCPDIRGDLMCYGWVAPAEEESGDG